ncbi:B12-binding domain-containing radical SAM protein [Nitrosopumilus sp.]|uniref:B12-binding domain-containing radical SAM protein n=1 Tax=Nitrosopumilus sp. TaxID=2024843 RepID=UPI003D126520
MDRPLKIYLGDLTYDTVAISTEATPLNVGFIASYCLDKFGDKVEITLFKYISDLENALIDSPPDILGLSNYCWSHNVSYEMFKLLSKKNPNSIKIWGGPNFPVDLPSQKQFMKKFTDIDAYVPIDGEIGFSNLVELVLKLDSLEQAKEKIMETPIDGCITRNEIGDLQFSIPTVRMKNLDEIPSPYLTGLMDKFFDGKLVPMLQTNRGCPFLCTYCTDGNSAVNMVNKFSKDRTQSEINYIAKHVHKNTHSMFISDLNFGMIPGDLETCNFIAGSQEKFNYPSKIIATTGKNRKEQIIEAIQRLNGSMVLYMSVQSLNEDVLSNIKRDNISTEKMLQLAPTIAKSGLNTMAEVILGLPGETYENHIESLRKLVATKMDDIIVHTCMLLDGSEMATPEQRNKWKFETKFRILPRDFTTLCSGKKICEIEEVIVSSKDMSFDEYVRLRMMGFTLWMSTKGVLYDSLIKFLHQNNVDVFELFRQMVERLPCAPIKIQKIFDQFKQSTIDELYDSPDEIISNIQDDAQYQNLLDGKGAINVYQYYQALVLTKYMDVWTDYLLQISKDLLVKNGIFSEEIRNEFSAISDYCRGTCFNPLGPNRMQTNPEFVFQYDVFQWLSDKNGTLLLRDYKFDSPQKILFHLSDDQFKIIGDTLEMYSDTIIGKTKVLKMISQQTLWRRPKII